MAVKRSRRASYRPGAMFSMSLIMRKTLTEVEAQAVCTKLMLKGSLPRSARSMSAITSRMRVLAASSSLKLW